MIRYLITDHKGKVTAGAIVIAVLIAFTILGLILPSQHATSPRAAPAPRATQRTGDLPPDGQGYNVLSGKERAMLDTAPDVAPATTAQLPPIPAVDRMQPDLYARAFFTTVFAHPYVGVTRDQMLAWVQAQQAASPFVTGGTPGELHRLLVESASDPAWSDHGYAALPDGAGWARAVTGRATVRIDRLSCVTPPGWETAISDGDITDPGLTARLVSANMTMTWTERGQRKRQEFSAALTLLLEGPPTTRKYGVVVIADTNVVDGASS